MITNSLPLSSNKSPPPVSILLGDILYGNKKWQTTDEEGIKQTIMLKGRKGKKVGEKRKLKGMKVSTLLNVLFLYIWKEM